MTPATVRNHGPLTAEAWNRKYPVGTRVVYHPVIGGPERIETRTTTGAWRIANGRGASVVLLACGCCPVLNHLEIPPEEPAADAQVA